MSELHAVVDRFEDRMAVLLLGREQYQVVVPRNLLPPDAGEGAVLNICIDVDLPATEEARRRVHSLIDRLRDGEG